MSESLTRTRADDFLELVARAKRGRLKLYVGFAAGVGKTFRMLEEGHALRARGVDVVVGFVETHRRADTAALLPGLELVPRRQVEYRGVIIEEMSLDAVLERKPEVALVDELAHTNVPGSRNRKRYQDAIELLDAGINVIGAFNVQHLESLKDVVERTTGVSIRETIPDSFLRQADQVVNLDLSVEDLQERLRAGKIYDAEKIGWALENFFNDQNLAHLRELALREVAESVERGSARRPASAEAVAAGGRRSGAGTRVMVCLSSGSPRGGTLVRKGSRLAGRLSSDWFVVFVETPRESPERIDAGAQRHLMANTDLARDLGAEVVRLRSADALRGILEFARSHGVGHVVVGRSNQAAWKQALGWSLPVRLVRQASGLDVHVVSIDDEGGA